MASDPATAYAQDVVDGKIPACNWVILAAKRHLRDLSDDRFLWDWPKALVNVSFFRRLRHYKGPTAGQAFELEPWQVFIIGSIYGWRWAGSKARRFRYVYVEVPRKNGKTTLSAGVGIQELSREQGAEVYSVATKEEQAKIGWRDGRVMVEKSPDLDWLIKRRVKSMHYEPNEAVWRPLSSESDTLDGLNPSCGLMDELHAWDDRALWDVIDDGMGARAEPLIFQITTAGFNQEGICYQQREHIIRILEQSIDDETYFGIIYTVDDPAKWLDEDEWRKANPNLGISKTWEFMRDQAAKAQTMPSKQNAFLNKQLNIWTQQEVRWIPIEAWDQCAESAGTTGPCFGGLDLGTTTDINALTLYWPETGAVKPYMWIPEAKLNDPKRSDRVPYADWQKAGDIFITPGNVVDYEYIRKQINELDAEFDIREIAFDRYNSSQLVTQLSGDGLEMVQFGQGFVSMSGPSKELEKLILSKAIKHGGHRVLRWMAGNVAIEQDSAGNIKPSKKRSREKIDGIVALVMAIGRATVNQKPAGSIYEERGIRTL